MDESKVKELINKTIKQYDMKRDNKQLLLLQDIFGVFKTIDDADDLTNTLAETPTSLYEQIFIHYNSTGPVTRLYIYDTVTKEWGYTALTIV